MTSACESNDSARSKSAPAAVQPAKDDDSIKLLATSITCKSAADKKRLEAHISILKAKIEEYEAK